MAANLVPNWYPRHVKDYQLDTAHLSVMEHGAYTLLLDHYYLSGKPLPADLSRLARMIRCTTEAEITAMTSVLDHYFQLGEDGYHNLRADLELKVRKKLLKTRADNAAKGAQARWHKPERVIPLGIANGIPQGTTDASLMAYQVNAQEQEQEQEQKQKKEQKPLKPVAVDKSAAQKNAVWEAYAKAYQERYHTLPIRNAKANALCKQLHERLGHEAADVASFYVGHSNQFYVTKGHALTILVADCEKVRTEWFTGNRITHTTARQLDKTQATGDVFRELIAEERARHG